MIKWADDPDKIKAVFDNIRNFLICGAVLYGGMFLIKMPSLTTYGKWQSIVTGVLLCLASIYLLLVNCRHATHVMFSDIEHEPSKKKRLISGLLFAVYITLAIPLFLSAATKLPVNGANECENAITKPAKITH